jgi:hypothetical protein
MNDPAYYAGFFVLFKAAWAIHTWVMLNSHKFTENFQKYLQYVKQCDTITENKVIRWLIRKGYEYECSTVRQNTKD